MAVPAPKTVGFAIRGPISRADLPGLFDRVCTLLRESGAGVVVCDVQDVAADCVTVDALCRVRLAAGRHRCDVRLRHASAELLDLVAFTGLTEVLPGSSVEPGRQAEERKHGLRVEEERQLDDPAV